MPNRSTDELFQLIKSLNKTEKRLFKLHVKRVSGSDELKMLLLFDALDKMDEYNEELLLKKNETLSKQQLSNTKAYLYKQILSGLWQAGDDSIDMQLNEQMTNAKILYNKGLYLQALKTLNKVKQHANSKHHVTYQLQALIFEKKIETLHITRSMKDRAEQLTSEATEVTNRLILLNQYSNLALQLYSWYIKMGHASDAKDAEAVKLFFETNIPVCNVNALGFYEKLYMYQAYSWYTFILQDFLLYYRYSRKWVDLFVDEPFMISAEASQYIKGIHNLLMAHFVLNNYSKFVETIRTFETFADSEALQMNMNTRTQTFVYLNIARINKHFMEGTFSEGVNLIPYLKEKLGEFKIHIDPHRILVFYYKIASLYFGSGNSEKSIDYLNKIINWKVDLRNDLQCYARLLHLIAHYELGNYNLLEYLMKSVYRFMAKMNNLSIAEEEIFLFLRKSFSLSPDKMMPAFKTLREKLLKHTNNRFETRSFLYLDIISWLESKIEEVPVQQIIRRKFLNTQKMKRAFQND